MFLTENPLPLHLKKMTMRRRKRIPKKRENLNPMLEMAVTLINSDGRKHCQKLR
jgi:hypothetical protein